MKFGHEYEKVLASEGFPKEWLGSAIDYKYLKKCIKKVHKELQELGLDAPTIQKLSETWERSNEASQRAAQSRHEFYSAEEPQLNTIAEEFTPQLRVLVDRRTGTPLDATLAPETQESLQRLARSEMVTPEGQVHPPQHATHGCNAQQLALSKERTNSSALDAVDARWIQIPLASAKAFFDLLGPKLEELEQLREAETHKLEDEILDLGARVEDVVEPVRDGFEAKRRVSYRDLYFWREMFRLYLENPVFYSTNENNAGALTFTEAKKRLEAYDQRLRETGLLAKMKTPAAKKAARQFLELNVDILKIIGFQEMNAEAMRKILKKFDKRTHLEGQPFLHDLQTRYPALLPPTASTTPTQPNQAVGFPASRACCTASFATSIARDLSAELTSKILGIVPQLDDWNCPVCLEMAWRPVSLRCCRALYCIRCIIRMQDEGTARCPACNAESVGQADARNLDFEAMDFLQKYFPLEARKRQRANEVENLKAQYGEEFGKPGCEVM